MARITFIRDIVERNGGTIVTWYSDGAKFDIRRHYANCQTEWPTYKVILENTPEEVKQKIVDEINTWGIIAHGVKRAYISRKYRGKGGHLKVVFNHAYCDFLRGTYS